MDILKSTFLYSHSLALSPTVPQHRRRRRRLLTSIYCCTLPDPWTLSDGSDIDKPKPRSKNPKNPLSDDNARRIIKAKAKYLSVLRRNQGSRVQTPKWIRRTPEQMVQYLEDDRNGHLYGKHVVAAIQIVRSLSQRAEGDYDMRQVMGSFVTKLNFREMCIVLKEQKGWRQVRDFFGWMKLQFSYRPSVIAYTIVLRAYGQVGKINMAEETFLEMLDVGCEPDEIACGTMLCAYARWGKCKAMLSFYTAVQERGVMLSLPVYNFMLSSLQKKSEHRNLIHMWRHMVDQCVTPNHFTFTLVICSLVKEGLLEEAFNTFNEMTALHFIPEEVTYSLLISSSMKCRNQDACLRLYDDMKSRGIVPSNFTCASLLTLYYRNGEYSKALSLFTEMESNKIPADEVIYGLLIRIYGKLGLYTDAEKTFEETYQLGLLSDEKTYIAMAQVHLSSGDYVKALSTMELMRSRNISYSRYAYIILVKCYIMKDDLVSAEVAFRSLSKTGLPDARSCNDMLHLYQRLGLLEKAKDCILLLRKDSMKFDEELCRTIMKVYSKEGMLREAESFMEEVKTCEIFKESRFLQTISIVMHAESSKVGTDKHSLATVGLPNFDALELMLSLYLANGNKMKTEETFNLFLKTAEGLSVANQLVGKFVHEGNLSRAEALYHLLIKLNSRPEDVISASMISLYGNRQSLKRAKEFFLVLANSSTTGVHIYFSLIDTCAKCGEPEEAYRFYKEATDKGFDVGAVAISIVVNTLINYGKYRAAEDVIHSSFRVNLTLDTVAYNTFIKAMMEAGKLNFATEIYDRMSYLGVPPSLQTYSTMISVYGRQRNVIKATKMFKMAQNLGLPLDEKAYTNLISVYGKTGKIHEASNLFIEMQEEGIKPGKVGYNIMMNVYGAGGCYREAEELFQAMQADGFSPDSFTYLALIRAYTEGLQYEAAEELIIHMPSKGLLPSCAHFNHLIWAFAKAGMIAEAERVFGKLLESNLSPDLACYRTMLRGYMDYGYAKEGISLFERIKESVEPDRFIMSAAVHLYRAAGKELEAAGVLESMNTLGIRFLSYLETGSKVKTLNIAIEDAKHTVIV